MGRTLAFLEGSAIFVAISGTALVWARPHLDSWVEVMAVLGQAFALSLCCIAAFYYTDLYDLRSIRSFRDFALRLPRSFGIAVILLAAVYLLVPGIKIPFATSLLVIVGLLLLLRACSYGIIRSRPLTERVLILGTSPLAHRLIQEIEAQSRCRCAM